MKTNHQPYFPTAPRVFKPRFR